MRKSWNHTTAKGILMIVEQLPSGKWLGQLTGPEIVETSRGPHLTITDFVLDHYTTAKDALDGIGYPVEIAGIPAELR